MPVDIWWRVEINYARTYNVQAPSAADAGVTAEQMWREDPLTPRDLIHTIHIRHALAKEVREPAERRG